MILSQRNRKSPSTLQTWMLLAAIFLGVQFASLFSPPLLDDVDASHAQNAQAMLATGDWVTMKTNGIAYIEKPPLPFWLVGICYRIFGENTFATHLPNALAVLGLAFVAWSWARRAWSDRVGLYAALAILTSIGPFLFTRFIIPEAIMSLLLLIALYSLLICLEGGHRFGIYWAWAALALALMIKGLIAPVFFLGGAIPYLLLSGQWRCWRRLKPFSGIALFLLIAAPWHILVGIANPGQGHPIGNKPSLGNVHGYWWFYLVNEHFLRFFGKRYPYDYNKLPFVLYWALHFVWLFPWSLFLPATLAVAWKARRSWLAELRSHRPTSVAPRSWSTEPAHQHLFRVRTIWLLGLFSAFTLIFFGISSNQEYYTFMVWPPLFMLIASVIVAMEESSGPSAEGTSLQSGERSLLRGHAAFAVLGLAIAVCLAWGLWQSRHLPFVADIGTLLAHRAVGNYTLSMSHFFDLTGPSFAALRLPATLAAITFVVGPGIGWWLRRERRHIAATISIALTSAVFLVAAHIAFARFAPMLSSRQMADTILQRGSPNDTFIILGEQSDASSVIFYTYKFFHGRPALLVLPRCGQHSEGTTLLWGSCYTNSPDIFLSDQQLDQLWGTGGRKWLFAQSANQTKAEKILGNRLFLVQTLADKDLWTDRPLK